MQALIACCIAFLMSSCGKANAEKRLVGSQNIGYVTPNSAILVGFEPAFAKVPVVNAWTRGNCGERFEVNIVEVREDGFSASVYQTYGKFSSPFHSNTILYWSATERIVETHALLGEYEVAEIVPIPPPNLFTVPTLNNTFVNTVNILGREIHTSHLRNVLEDKHITTTPYVSWDNKALTTRIIVRTDTFYIDDDISTFYGPTNVKIYARRIVSNGGIFKVKSPQKCPYLAAGNTVCTFFGKAGSNSAGRQGKDGFSSTSLDVYSYQVRGNVNITIEASGGSRAEHGGDGSAGTDGENGTKKDCGTKDDGACRKCDLFDDGKDTPVYGNNGEPGENGRPGSIGGTPGNGGSVDRVSIFTQHLSGFVKLNQVPGAPAIPSVHGYAGVGGIGGEGSCGCICNGWLMCILIICWPECSHRGDDCGTYKGYDGPNGACGSDGFDSYYRLPYAAIEGEIAKANLKTVESVRSWFEKDLELLYLIRRNGEMLFQRGSTEEAAEVFMFILDVTDETSVLYNEVAIMLEYINEGFDYYGNTEIYAPDKDWVYLKERAEELLLVGEDLETSFNEVLENINVIHQTSELVQDVVTLSATANINILKFEQNELRSQKVLYVKAMKQLEIGMAKQMAEIFRLLQSTLKEYIKEKISGVLDLLGGIVGCTVGLLTANPQAATAGANSILDFLRREKCEGPSIKEMTESIGDNLRFAFEYEVMPASDLDFGAMDASAVPVIMQSSLSKNRGQLMEDLRCLFETTDDGPALERVMNDYFNDGAFRIELIDMIINMDIRLKQIEYNIQVCEDTVTTVDNAVESAQTSVEIEGMYSFTDVLLNLYQQQENLIMAAIYEESKAYQFESLMEFDVFSRYTDVFSDQATINTLRSLEGMFQLQLIKQELENQRDVFLDHVASIAGPTSHVFTSHVGFDLISHPDIMASLRETGQATISIPLVANNPSVTGCESCYNARLVGLYIEVVNEGQPSSVPARTFVKVSHQGNNHFLKPLESGGDVVTLLQQTPEDEDGGKIMSFDSDNLVSSVLDPRLQFKFGQDEYRFCDSDLSNFFGSKPCKSPFATYLITVPRNDEYKCTTNPNDFISGTNCQDFDFSKLTAINFYSKVTSWSNYPTDEDIAISYRNRQLEQHEKSGEQV